MIIRQSHIVLIARLIAIELLLAFIYLVVRIPKTIFLSPYFDASQNSLSNFFSLGYFMVLSFVELFLVLQVTLSWANEIYEIREDSILHRNGIFTLKEDVFTLRNLGSSTIQQGFFGKLLNYGTITLSSPVLKREYYLLNIHDPKKVVQSLEDNIEGQFDKQNIIRKTG